MVALVDKNLRQLIESGVISSPFFHEKSVQPASVDLPIGDVAYLMKNTVLPSNVRIDQLLETHAVDIISLKEKQLLHKGNTYFIPSIKADLPEHIYAYLSPKSSIGRVDLLVRGMVDNFGFYDVIPAGSKKQVWLQVKPQSFHVRLQEGIELSQLMAFEDSSVQPTSRPLLLDEEGNDLFHRVHKDDVTMHLGLPGDRLVGYVAKDTGVPIDLTQKNSAVKTDYFNELQLNTDGSLTLEKGKFYILATKELVVIPKDISVEMLPFSHRIGELRVHYAGFFDPGFGAPRGASGVLEVRPHETMTVYDGQPICMMRSYSNKQVPESLYGESGSNYQGQIGPRLAKYFKQD